MYLPTHYLGYLGYLSNNPSRLPTYLPSHILHMYPPTSYVLTYPSRYLGPCCNIYNFISARCHIYIGMLSTAHYTLPHACCQVFRCTLHIATSCMYCQLHIAIFSSPLCQVVNYILASFQVHIAKFTFPSFHVHIGKFSNAHCHVFK